MIVGEEYRTMQEIVYNTIKERILAGHYKAGQRLVTNDLAMELGVSRMPVREALQRLEAATGLLSRIPHKGAVVNAISQDDILEVFCIRAVLESLAARMACLNLEENQIDHLEAINREIIDVGHTIDEQGFLSLNAKFHEPIWQAAKAPRLVGMLRSLYDASRGYRYISLKLPGRFEEIVEEHAQIVVALRGRDPDVVERVVKEHYQQTLKWLTRERDSERPQPSPALHLPK